MTPTCPKCSSERFKFVREYSAADEWRIRSLVWNDEKQHWDLDVDSSKVSTEEFLELNAEAIECEACGETWWADRQGYTNEGHDEPVSIEWN